MVPSLSQLGDYIILPTQHMHKHTKYSPEESEVPPCAHTHAPSLTGAHT